MRQTVSFLFVAMCVAVPVAAQQAIREIPAVPAIPAMVEQQAPPLPPPPARVPAPTPPPAPQRAPTPPAAPEAPSAPRQVDPRIDPSDVNIKLTVKITDSSGSGTQTKIVSMIMANRGSGRVRSQGVGPGNNGADLNVDARATLYKSGAINTGLTISYTPERTDEPSKLTSVSQSVELFLKEGVATVITQAADPTKGSRSVTIEVTASVMK